MPIPLAWVLGPRTYPGGISQVGGIRPGGTAGGGRAQGGGTRCRGYPTRRGREVAMPTRGLQPCLGPGCTNRVKKGRCSDCLGNKQRASDQMRGTSSDRGYSSRDGWRESRRAAIRRDVQCQCESIDCDHVALMCGAPSEVADHYPLSRRDLVRSMVLDPNAPEYLRGLCPTCHNMHTARNQPGGWNRQAWSR